MFGNLVDATGEASANDMRAREGVGAASIGALTALGVRVAPPNKPSARHVAHLRAAAHIQAVSTIQISGLSRRDHHTRHQLPDQSGLFTKIFPNKRFRAT